MAGERTLLYFADPMCSWCWGFAPVIDRVVEAVGDRGEVLVVMGGLAPGTRGRLTARLKASIREHWEHVHEATGQPFDVSFFDRDQFEYDTEPACRAVVAARKLDESTTLGFLHELHRQFYAHNRDVTDTDVLCDIAAEYGLDRDAFAATFADPEIEKETRADFALSRQLGVTGFPTLIAQSATGRPALLTIGYRPWEEIEESLERALS